MEQSWARHRPGGGNTTHYQLLGVGQDATTEEIRSAWRRAMRTVHSDVGGDDRQAQIYNLAYEVLRNPEKRRHYDAELAAARREALWSVEEDWPEEPDWDDPDWEAEPPRETGETGDTGEHRAQPRRREPPRGPRPTGPPRTWADRVDPATPVRAYPPPGRYRTVYLVAAAVWLAADLALVATTVLGGNRIDLVLLALIPLAAPLRWHAWVLSVCGLLVAALLVVGVILVLGRPGGWLPAAFLLLLLVGLAVTRVLGERWMGQREVDLLVGAQTTYRDNLFGEPGAGLVAGMVAKRGDQDDWAAERASAELLAAVLAIPGSKMFHAAPLPGGRSVCVDHILVCGDRVALVDNRYWPPGHYDLDAYGMPRRDGIRVAGSAVSLEQAVDAWRRYLPRAAVHGFLVVWSTGATATGAGSRCTLASTDTAADVIGSWLAPAAGTVHRAVLHRVLTSVG